MNSEFYQGVGQHRRGMFLQVAGGVFLVLIMAVSGCASLPDPLPLSYGETTPSIPAEVPRFSWDNATVYFVITDRFYNGDPSNDFSYGRFQDGDQEIGTFNGGDLAGLTKKLNEGYFTELGVDAIWITSPLEQIHGWVGGGNGSFAHFAYHGYYHKDFTQIDANMGSEEDFAEFVDTAHSRGIRVVLDVVLNHPGYNSVRDMIEFDFGGWKGDPLPADWVPQNGNWHSHHDFIDYSGSVDQWARWWGPQWIRAGLPGYTPAGSDDLTNSVGLLPDFRTESSTAVDLPVFLLEKAAAGNSGVEPIEGFTVRDYLIHWLVEWVEKYGIDGFRADTAKHVELDAWNELKTEAQAAFDRWKAANPDKVIDDTDFWMTGEVFSQGVNRNSYFDNGFDSLINFEFQMAADRAIDTNGVIDGEMLDPLYTRYAESINSDPGFNMLSYISSHDTVLFNDTTVSNNGYRVNGRATSAERQKAAGTVLLMAPGAVQIFYGDEIGRKYGRYLVGDAGQGTRTPMDWDAIDEEILEHWQKLGQFRNRHIAVGAGVHQAIEVRNAGYAFARSWYGLDSVVVVTGAQGPLRVPVGQIWADGTVLRDFYSGETAVVENSQVSFTAASGTLLIETGE